MIRRMGWGKAYNYWARVMSEWSWWGTKRKGGSIHIQDERGSGHNLHVLSVQIKIPRESILMVQANMPAFVKIFTFTSTVVAHALPSHCPVLYLL